MLANNRKINNKSKNERSAPFVIIVSISFNVIILD